MLQIMFGDDLRKYPELHTLYLKVGADKANGHKGQALTTLGISTNPVAKKYSNSALETKVAGMYEGAGDDAKSIHEFLSAPVAQIQKLIDDGEILLTINGEVVSYPVVVKLGGDGKYISSALMHQGFSATCGCWLCEIPLLNFMETRPEELKKSPTRTLQSIKEYGHMVAGIKCKGCELQITATQAQADALNDGTTKRNRKAIKVCVGDPSVDPPQPWVSRTVDNPAMAQGKEVWEWGPRHKSIQYGGNGWDLLWDAELTQWVVCFLHARLRLTALVFAVCVTQWLDTGWTPSKAERDAKVVDGPQTLLVTELVNCMLPGKKVKCMEKPKTLLSGRAVRGNLAGLHVQNFEGPVATVLNEASDVFLEAAFPSVECTPGSPRALTKARCTLVWNTFKEFLAKCREPLQSPTPATVLQEQAVRDARGDELDQLGRSFVEALKVIHPTSRSWYVHWAAAHAGDQARQHGEWTKYAMDGLEAKHSTSKQLQLRLTNSKLYERLKTLVSHYVHRDGIMHEARADEDLSLVVELKEKQQANAQATRLKTTSKRLSARFEDLSSTLSAVKSAEEVPSLYRELSLKRQLETTAAKKEATLLRRRSKKLKLVETDATSTTSSSSSSSSH